MNNQKPTKQMLRLDQSLLVNEIFYTIQGEGPFSGRPAVFIRLAGCNLQCTWCDTEYSKNTRLTEQEVLEEVDKVNPLFHDMLVVITGGEPFRQNISSLCRGLLNMGHPVQIETNGTLSNLDFPWKDVHVVVSPKTKFIHDDFKKNFCYYKYAVSSDDAESEDGLPVFNTQFQGGGVPAKPPFDIPLDRIYLSSLDSHCLEQNFNNQKTTVDLCMKFGYTISLQTHKLLNLP